MAIAALVAGGSLYQSPGPEVKESILGFPKIKGHLLGVPIIRIIVVWGLHWGPLFREITYMGFRVSLGNFHRDTYICIHIHTQGFRVHRGLTLNPDNLKRTLRITPATLTQPSPVVPNPGPSTLNQSLSNPSCLLPQAQNPHPNPKTFQPKPVALNPRPLSVDPRKRDLPRWPCSFFRTQGAL